MSIKTAIAALLGLAALLGAPARAATQTLAADAGWAEFSVDGNLPPYGLDWQDLDGSALNFSIVIPQGFIGRLTVVDAGFSGDRYALFNHGALLGQTGAALNGDANGAIQLDFDAALADAAFSRGQFQLGAGSHLISGRLIASTTLDGAPLNASLGGLRLAVSPVPEPASAATLLGGLALLAGLRRRAARR